MTAVDRLCQAGQQTAFSLEAYAELSQYKSLLHMRPLNVEYHEIRLSEREENLSNDVAGIEQIEQMLRAGLLKDHIPNRANTCFWG